jgi:phosphate uptake regulator
MVCSRQRPGTWPAAGDTLSRSRPRHLQLRCLPQSISVCTHLLFCAKNIKRVGDHVTDIAETVHYLVTGQPIEEHAA